MRVSKRIVAEQFVPTSTTPPSDVGIYRVNRKALGVTGRIDTFDPETKVISSVPQTLFQSGTPFVIFAGDGGSNGLSFSGTDGQFTLSAEPMLAGSWAMISAGCYAYIPAGAGGLASGGWYWCTMSSATAGRIFTETYSGTGTPASIASPTPHPNLSAGRITQSTSEIVMLSFVLPGGAMGPNGSHVFKYKHVASNSANAKRFRLKNSGNATAVHSLSVTTGFLNQVTQHTSQNAGHQSRLIKAISNAGSGLGDSGGSNVNYGGDMLVIDSSIDQTISCTMQLASNLDSLAVIPWSFTVQYGA